MLLETEKPNGLYIVMLSIHGLVRSNEPELGRDPDTGGQVKYVIELARALSEREEVERVDLLTRQIIDPKVDSIYEDLFEEIAPKAVLVRIPFGPRRYLRKEVLWPHLQVFEDNVLHHLKRVGRLPDIIHGHYADAGLSGARLAYLLGVPFAFTGHSLGMVKNQRLLDKGMSQEKIEETYHISQRIMGEETALEAASLIVASTHQEVEEQYRAYENFNTSVANVIPPGVDLSAFESYAQMRGRPTIQDDIERFLRDPQKPMVLALARPDERKNLLGLLNAYAESPQLRDAANLVIVAGNRDDIAEMEPGSRRVLDQMLRAVDKHDLYGQVAYPKHHRPDQVADIYRLAAKSGGVFVNPALTEPFGLTLIEAAACGVPIVATNDGGPRDITSNCQNGELVDPFDNQAIADAILGLVENKARWQEASQKGLAGVRRHYSWESHVTTYLDSLQKVSTGDRPARPVAQHRNRLLLADCLLISDIDNTLLGDKKSLAQLMGAIKEAPVKVAFGVATGRHLDSARRVLKEWGVKQPNLAICSVGSEIFSGPNLVPDQGWAKHLDHRWDPQGIHRAMEEVPGIALQSQESQARFKISYDVQSPEFPGVASVRNLFKQKGLTAKVIYSHGKHLDILSHRASKGKALRYVAVKWGIVMERIIVAGDSGNDREMLTLGTPAVVVGNYSKELASLKKRKLDHIYFAKDHYAGGILEALKHFDFLAPGSKEY
jgi:sucrose-phosphate synthase